MPNEQRQHLAGTSQTQGPSPQKVAPAPEPTPAPEPALFDSYHPLPGSHDEHLAPDGTPRPSVAAFHNRLNELGKDGLSTAWKRGDELLKENGLSYNILGESSSFRPWNLDPIPLLFSEAEWQPLAQAAIQRARLWDAILKDCYGPRTLLSEGILPPALLFAQPGFNRSLPLPNPDSNLLTFYSVDVARSTNGSWTVIADRTEAPNGTGYALENRIILTNVFPETSNKLHLIRLAAYFQSLQSTLFAKAPHAVDEPGVVLLSPGPDDPTYFEDAYLARYLGIPVAVGEELTVRDDRLFLKTVSGLKRIHVLYRRVHETLIDPLENPVSSNQGVPGIMQAIRSGMVTVVNPPGTGIAESPAFMPYLPAIAQRMLGQDLLIPSVETIWGGQLDSFNTALPRFLEHEPGFLKNSFGPRKPPLSTQHLEAAGLDEVQREIARNPAAFTLQRQMDFSTAPVWTSRQTLEPRPVALRLFLFHDGTDFQIMPGALVRCAPSPDSLPGLSLNHDSGSKDLWILAEQPNSAHFQTNLPDRESVRRSAGTLSSRAADNLYWIGRYAERAEFATRCILEIAHRLSAEHDDSSIQSLEPILKTLSNSHYLPEKSVPLSEEHPRTAIRKLLLPVFFAETHTAREHSLDSIPQNLIRLRNLASLSSDRLSGETWLIIQQLHELCNHAPSRNLGSLRPILQKALTYHSAFNGTCRENLTRNLGWIFLNLGRKLERSAELINLISEVLLLPPERRTSSVLDAVLAINDVTLTYRFRYQGAPQTLPALDLILHDPANPRSLAYQLGEIDRDLSQLSHDKNDDLPSDLHRFVLRALHFLETEVLDAQNDEDEREQLQKLTKFIINLRDQLPEMTEQLGWQFFTHAEPQNT